MKKAIYLIIVTVMSLSACGKMGTSSTPTINQALSKTTTQTYNSFPNNTPIPSATPIPTRAPIPSGKLPEGDVTNYQLKQEL